MKNQYIIFSAIIQIGFFIGYYIIVDFWIVYYRDYGIIITQTILFLILQWFLITFLYWYRRFDFKYRFLQETEQGNIDPFWNSMGGFQKIQHVWKIGGIMMVIGMICDLVILIWMQSWPLFEIEFFSTVAYFIFTFALYRKR